MKKTNKIICLLLTMIISIENCYAANASFLGQLLSGGNTQITGPEEPTVYWSDYPSGGKMYRYGYKRELISATTISMNAYNLEGESVIPYSVKIDPKKYTFKAGTWIGINVTETHGGTWRVYDFEYKEVQKKYTCNYSRSSSSYKCNCKYQTIPTKSQNCHGNFIEGKLPNGKDAPGGWGTCMIGHCDTCYTGSDSRSYTYVKPYNEKFTCPSNRLYNGYTYNFTNFEKEDQLVDVSDKSLISSMKEKTIEEVHTWALNNVSWSAGLVKYITNNNYPNNPEDLTYNTINQGNSSDYSVDEIIEETPNQVKGYVEREYELLEKKVCMNLKTSEVTYGRDCKTSDGEIQIENGNVTDKYWLDKNNVPRKVNYWHYFIPLNTKSNSEFTLDIVKNENRVFSIDECEQFMKTNDEYVNYIVPIDASDDNGTFIGDYKRYTDKNLSLDYNKLKNGNGCNISTKIVFPISQEFYNEATNKIYKENIKLKGFNFYYKPVDIDNPFPNGIATNSLWKEWEKSETKNPNISKSYNKITYVAENISAKKVREYNNTNSYTSWKNMNINGNSKFIDNENMIIRSNNAGSVYALGCGPANENEYLDTAKKVKNFLYQEECAK